MLNTVIANPNLLLTTKDDSTYEPSLEVTRQQNEINRLMDSVNIDFNKGKEEIFKLAQMKYDCCSYDDRPQKTKVLMEKLADCKQLNILDLGLFKSVISQIRVSHLCTIEIEFINDVILKNLIERTDNSD